MGFTNHGVTQMQITQRCSSGDRTEVVVLVVVVVIHTVLLMHPHFTPCLLGAALPRLPVPRLGSTAPAAALRAWHPTSTAGSMAPASLFSENPNLELARGTQPSWGRAPWSLQRVFCTIFCLTAGHAPAKHSGSGHLTPSGSSITSMQHSTIPHMIPGAGWWQHCCRLVTQLLGKVPGVPMALHWEGMASRGDGTCSRRERR